MNDFTNFRAVYDFLTDEVLRASHAFIPDHLENWFRTIDETPLVRAIIERLEGDQDARKFIEECCQLPPGSLVGSIRLNWPDDPEKRIGMKLRVFREVARKEVDVTWLGQMFTSINSSRLDDYAREFMQQVFGPLARELRRFLEQRAAELSLADIPASDRIVAVNDNSRGYRETVDALEKLEQTLTDVNDYPDPEDREQRVAEISAGRRLLRSTRVRISALVSVLGPALTYLAIKFGDQAIGQIAKSAWDLLQLLINQI